MLTLNYIVFPFYTFLTLISIMGYGYIFKHLFKNKLQIMNLKNPIFIQGLFFIGCISAVINFFIPLTNPISLTILLIGFLINLIFFEKFILKKKKIIFVFFVIILSSFLSINAGINDDFNYHLDTILNYKSKTLFEIEHSRRVSYNSFWLFLHSIISVDYFTSTYFVLGSVIYSIALYDSLKLFRKSIKKENYYVGICSFFVIVFLIGVLNKYKEFGTDIPGFILSIYILYVLFNNSFDDKNYYSNEILQAILILACMAFVIKITNTLIFLYLIVILTRIKYSKLNLIYLSIPFCIVIIWFFQNYNISGCLVWPQEISCFKNSHLAVEEAYLIESFAKGDINTQINANGFDWISVWLKNHSTKMIEIYLLYFILLLSPIMYFYFFSKEKIYKFNFFSNKDYLLFLSLVFVANSFWFLIAPAYRFGLFYNLSFIILLLLPFWIILIKKFKKKIKIYSTSLIIVVSIYFIIENILKYSWYEKRYDIWPPIKNGKIIERKDY